MEHVFGLYAAGHISEAELLWVAMIGYLDDADTDGQVSDREILSALQFLVDNGVVRAVEVYADEGDFYVEYEPNPDSPRTWGYSAAEYLQGTYLLEDNTEWLNETYKLPYNVEISGKECGVVNAFYSPSQKKITMCYEYVDYLLDMGYDLYGDSTYAEDFAYNVLDGTLMHETGHALVDIYDLPVTGLEEDAVDQFAALMQSRTYTDYGSDYEPDYAVGQDMMFDVSTAWNYAAQTETPAYWDVHSLSIQRFYNIACYAYGADPVYNSDLVGDYLPADRADGCQGEYEKIESSWDRLLEEYMIE